MRRAAPVLVALSAVAACAQLGALFGAKPEPTPAPQAASREQTARQEEAARLRQEQDAQRRAEAAAEAERREQALLADLERHRADLSAGTGDRAAAAIAFAGVVQALAGSQAAATGTIDLAVLAGEATGHLDAALQQAPSLELLRALSDLPRSAAADAAFVRACPKLRPRVPAEYVLSFVGDCLERAGGEAGRLKWAGAQKDVAAYRRREAEALRQAQEAEAERAREEARRAEAEQRARVDGESYVAAAVFAAGRCNFGDCGKDGWSVDTAAGTVRVRCNFGNCLKDGWVAEFPGRGSARTTCNFGDCFKDGWRTELPDGQTASTRCNFSDCPKDGWTTEIPGLGTAHTRCNFQDCLKDGWSTDLPTGGQVRCRCNFQDCRTNGATCD